MMFEIFQVSLHAFATQLSSLHFGLMLALLASSLSVMFVPLFVAVARNHNQMMWIALLNTLLGWTGVGWAAALVWALSEPGKKSANE